MTNHVHLLVRAKPGYELAGIIRDLKKFTSGSIRRMIEEHSTESRSRLRSLAQRALFMARRRPEVHC